MSVVAIIGAGPIGTAVAHRLAERGRFREIRLLDEAATAAAGKALDIRQAAPIQRFDTAVLGSAGALSAAGAAVIVLADDIEHGEWSGDRGLALLQRLHRAGTGGPIVFAGPRQADLMQEAAEDLKLDRHRLVGTAASAQVGAARSLVGLELDRSPVAVDLVVAGRPPASVVAWMAATVSGILLTEQMPPHRLLALTATLRQFWPPGPYAIASATAPVVEALAFGSRRPHQAMTLLDGEFGLRGVPALLPLDLGRGGIRERIMPSLSPQERTEVMKAIGT